MAQETCVQDVMDNCNDRFTGIEGQLKTLTEMSKKSLELSEKTHNKLFVSNGDRALVELVRDNKEEGKRIKSALRDHIRDESHEQSKTTQEIADPQIGTIKKDQNYTEIENRWLGKLRTNDPAVQNGLRIFVILIGLGAFIYMVIKLEEIHEGRSILLDKIATVEQKVDNDQRP